MAKKLTPTEMEQTTTWVMAAKSGDDRAFAKLQDRFQPLLKTTASKIAQITGDVESGESDALFALLRCVNKWEPDKGTFIPFLRRSLVNVITDTARAAAIRGGRIDWEAIEEPCADTEPIEDQMDMAQYRAAWCAWIEAVADSCPVMLAPYVRANCESGRWRGGFCRSALVQCGDARQLYLWSDADPTNEVRDMVVADGWGLIERRVARWSSKRIHQEQQLSRDAVRCLLDLLVAWAKEYGLEGVAPYLQVAERGFEALGARDAMSG